MGTGGRLDMLEGGFRQLSDGCDGDGRARGLLFDGYQPQKG